MSLLNGNTGGAALSAMKDENGNTISLWNYSAKVDKGGNPRKDYKESIEGTVVDMCEVQATKYQSTELDWWDDEQTQPKMDIEIALKQADGTDIAWHIKPGSRTKYEKFKIARKGLVDAARKASGNPQTLDITQLLGHKLRISTKEMVVDGKVIPYGSGNARPWTVELLEGKDDSVVRFGKESIIEAQPQVEEQSSTTTETTAVAAAKEAQAASEQATDPYEGDGSIPF